MNFEKSNASAIRVPSASGAPGLKPGDDVVDRANRTPCSRHARGTGGRPALVEPARRLLDEGHARPRASSRGSPRRRRRRWRRRRRSPRPGSSSSSRRSAFGFVKTSKFFFSSRNSRPLQPVRPGTSVSASGTGSACSVSAIFSAPRVPRRQCGGYVVEIVGRRRRSPGRSARGRRRRRRAGCRPPARPRRAAPSPAPRSSAPGTASLPSAMDEVDLRVDVPEDALHVTSSSRGFTRKRRPTFADGLPSVSTMSPVKSFEPRISDEPTP